MPARQRRPQTEVQRRVSNVEAHCAQRTARIDGIDVGELLAPLLDQISELENNSDRPSMPSACHPGCARLAACTARSTSSREASGTMATESPVEGSSTSRPAVPHSSSPTAFRTRSARRAQGHGTRSRPCSWFLLARSRHRRGRVYTVYTYGSATPREPTRLRAMAGAA